MATKLGRKVMPAGYSAGDFTYRGRPSTEQGDFGADVGIADMACVNQFGEANNSKHYHAGVVQAHNGKWFVYLEWGRIKPGKSWDGGFTGQDYQFVACDSESDARTFFADQCRDKNTKRLQQTTVAGKQVWAAKEGKDGYLVQRLATRERGLPDAYTIKDGSGVTVTAAAAPAPVAVTPTSRAFQPQVIALAQALVGGTRDYARAASSATGIVPTLAAIDEVRNDCIPTALRLISKIGNDVSVQLADQGMRDLSKYVATQIPRAVPRGGDPLSILLTTENIFALQQDLDAFEAALKTEDFGAVTTTPGYDPDRALNATTRWIDPGTDEGRWLAATYHGMDDRKHANARNVRIRNMFAVSRPDRDAAFVETTKRLADLRKGKNMGAVAPRLQPPKRIDLADIGDYAHQANVFLGIHGTRSVNVGPILGSNFRLPKFLSGVHISGAAFGGGVYFAVQVGKSAQYVGFRDAAYGAGGGISGRGHFMFLCDVAGGKFHYPERAWTIGDRCPAGSDSVFAHPRYCSTLQNDEHVIFDPTQQRIRYLIEVDL